MDYLMKLTKFNFNFENTYNFYFFISEITKKVGYFENRVYFKHKYALQQLKYLMYKKTPH